MIEIIARIAAKLWESGSSQYLSSEVFRLIVGVCTPEMKAVRLYLCFLGAVMHSAQIYTEKDCSIQGVVEPLLVIAEQGYLPAEKLILQMLDCENGIFRPEQWEGATSPLSLKQRIGAISILRNPKQIKSQQGKAENGSLNILDEIILKQRCLTEQFEDMHVQDVVEKIETTCTQGNYFDAVCFKYLDELQENYHVSAGSGKSHLQIV